MVPWVRSERCQEAFEDTTQALTSSPVLVLPDYSKHFEVVYDVSISSTGAVLLQEGRPVALQEPHRGGADVDSAVC